MYPVDGARGVKNENNMRIQMFSKRLWVCPSCGENKQLNNREFMRMIMDFKRGKYID
jgi:hypothetical protein